jgi:hypothetical protein
MVIRTRGSPRSTGCGWDVFHLRAERVVARSMALFCAVLDTFLAVVVLAVTLA